MDLIRKHFFRISQVLTRRHKQMVIWLADVIIAPPAFLLACLFTYGQIWPTEQLFRLLPLFPTVALAGGMASLGLGLPWIKLKSYESFGPGGLIPYAAMVGGAVLMATMLPALNFPVVGTLAFTLILFLAAFGLRITLLQLFLWALRFRKPMVRVLIYGAGTTGLQLASALRSHETISVVAFVDDDPTLRRERLAGLRIHPGGRIEEVVANYEISRVILAMPSLSAPKQARLGRQLQALGLEVQVLPSFAQLVGTEVLVDKLTPLSAGYFLGRDRLDKSIPSGGGEYRGRSVMVSGAGGSVGSELSRQILACHPRRLVLFEVSEHALYTIDKELRELCSDGLTEIVPVLGSVADARLTRQALDDNAVDVVLHAAAYKHVPLVENNPIAGLANNVLGTRTLADACLKQGVRRFIMISTDKAVRPVNVMGASKRLAEMVVQDLAARAARTQFSIVRFGNVLGSSGSVVPLFKEQIARGGPVTLTHDDVTRYFMTISEAARLVLLAGSFRDEDRPGRADVFVLDMGKPVRIRQLAEQLIHAAGYTVRDALNPTGDIEIKVTGLRPGEKLHEELLIGGGMEKTPHPKILRAAEEATGDLSVSVAVQELGRLIAIGDAGSARALALSVALGECRTAPAVAMGSARVL
ncbi:polysaccharide biosynthesis protein [Pseudogemmobacter sonorensis]|uniref:polysaccharide biosynthesis protein n=1 Tax=Pseudogemmobacter sonorensis TaxID=2989681 RepID=UPI00367EA497